jgi:hypothetical protein
MSLLTPSIEALKTGSSVSLDGIKSSLWNAFSSIKSRWSKWFENTIKSHTGKYFWNQTDAIKSDATYRNISSIKEAFKTVWTKPRALLWAPLRYGYAGLQSLGMSSLQFPRQTAKLAGWTAYDSVEAGIWVWWSLAGWWLAGLWTWLQSAGTGIKDYMSSESGSSASKVDKSAEKKSESKK